MATEDDSLSPRIVGGWLLHHDQKLLNARTTEFENIAVAGRASRLLSVISREQAWSVEQPRVVELARSIGIRRHEVDGLLGELQGHGLIERGQAGVSVLGVSQAQLLKHAAEIFESQEPLGIEMASIDLAERGSHTPVRRSDCAEELSDTYKLGRQELEDLFRQSEHIGFIDYELTGEDRLYFNGSLFKRDQAEKARRIFDTLSQDERQKLLDIEQLFNRHGCLHVSLVHDRIGPILWSKLHQIGYFEVSVVTNEHGPNEFVTKPEALTKFIPGGLADMLDDAKALASSLAYGIMNSTDARGRIRDPSVLIGVLIERGYVEGRASALRSDYHILERRGVVQVTDTPRGHRLTLLKKEVGEMARDLLLRGDASGPAIEHATRSSAASYVGPEVSRTAERRKDIPDAKSSMRKSLNILRGSG